MFLVNIFIKDKDGGEVMWTSSVKAALGRACAVAGTWASEAAQAWPQCPHPSHEEGDLRFG